MRFLIEIEHRTTTPVVIEADSQEAALQALWEGINGEPTTGDPVYSPLTVANIKVLGE